MGEELIEGTRSEWESKGVILITDTKTHRSASRRLLQLSADDCRHYKPTNRRVIAPARLAGDGRSTVDLCDEGFVLCFLDADAYSAQEMLDQASELGIPLQRVALAASLDSLTRAATPWFVPTARHIAR